MRVLITGAFGNIGLSTIEEVINQGDIVRCFDLKTTKNESIFRNLKRKYKDRIEVHWGDITKEDDIRKALEDQDVVVHLAFIIPKLSSTGLESEKVPDIAYKINVIGTKNLVSMMEILPKPKKLIFTSSVHVFGLTQHLEPPRKSDDPVNPHEHYSRHKLECENIIKNSNLTWSIYRLSASLPINLKLDIGMFDVPLNNRMEYVHTKDVGFAIAKGIKSDKIWKKVLLIGGGPRCQYYYKDIVEKVLKNIGLGMLPEEAFSDKPFATDWMDTRESEEILHYQRRTLEDYIEDVKKTLGYKIFFIRLFSPTIRYLLLKKSPYYKKRYIPLKVLLEGYRF
ncbi:MAG: NAD(P)-dependent oxidoreductase [Dictyoglomaceae bacterium]